MARRVRTDIPPGTTPTGCGLGAYAVCETNARPACTRFETIDETCTSDHGASFVGYLCTVADAPAECIQLNLEFARADGSGASGWK